MSLAFNETGMAEAAIKELLGKREGGPQPADWLLAAQLAAHDGAGDQAAADLQKIVADPKASERQQLQASLLLLATATADTPAAKQSQTESWERSTKIAQGKTAAALDALSVSRDEPSLRLLNSQLSRLRRGRATAWQATLNSQLLNSLPLSKIIHSARRLGNCSRSICAFMFRLTKRKRSLERPSNVGKAARPNRSARSARGSTARESFNASSTPFRSSAPWRRANFSSSDSTPSARSAEIKRLLQGERFPLDAVVATMYLARCNQQLGEIAAAENNWQRALEAAARAPEKLMQLGEYAEKNGATKAAAAAYDSASEVAPKRRAAWEGKLRLAQANRDTRRLHGVLAGMLQIWLNDSAIENDEAYTRLLLLPNDPSSSSESPSRSRDSRTVNRGSATPSTQPAIAGIEAAEDLVRREPARLPNRTLLALARLKLGQPGKALQVYTGLNVPRSALSPSALAVHAAVLAANGQERNAKTEASQIKSNQLLPEEEALVEELKD